MDTSLMKAVIEARKNSGAPINSIIGMAQGGQNEQSVGGQTQTNAGGLSQLIQNALPYITKMFGA